MDIRLNPSRNPGDRINFLTPVGRIVGGSCFEGQTKDSLGNPKTYKSGANMGQPRTDYYLALAIAKTDAGFAELHSDIVTAARECFPQFFDAAGTCNNPSFAFKLVDGDSQTPNTSGKKPCDKSGYPGHWVLNFSSTLPFTTFETGGKVIIEDPARVYKGCYVRMSGSVVGNKALQQPGVYLNPGMVEFVGYGERIATGPTGESVFGAAPAAVMPAGCTAAPAAPAAVPAALVPAPAAVGVPAVHTSPAPVAAVPAVAAAPGFLNPAAPAVKFPDIAAPAAAPVAPVMYAVQGGTYTAEQLTDFGFTAEQIAASPRA